MLFRYLPWNFIIRRAARSYGFIDPAAILARLRNLGQPSEFEMPLEIVRHAVIFHARGVINTRTIQHNLDWIWPYWIERQYDPHDPSFLPRSAHFSHVNLTHRNWTSVGLPNLPLYPLVDPRHLVTPLFDGWSVDVWLLDPRGALRITPSQLLPDAAEQVLEPAQHAVASRFRDGEDAVLAIRTEVTGSPHGAEIKTVCESNTAGTIAVSIRPYNTEGVRFVDSILHDASRQVWTINSHDKVELERPPERILYSSYADGDVSAHLDRKEATSGVHCAVGLATAVALFPVAANEPVSWRSPLKAVKEEEAPAPLFDPQQSWDSIRGVAPRLRLPDERVSRIYEGCVNTLLHLSAGKVYPGPYTYHRFWYRDASLMLNALLALNYRERVRKHLDWMIPSQRRDGYFDSQEGEWDSNGEMMWIAGQYDRLSGERAPRAWDRYLEKSVRWLDRKRNPRGEHTTAGLLPAGFSAEHFGPNDNYFWDDFWAIAGLDAVEELWSRTDESEKAAAAAKLRAEMWEDLNRALQRSARPARNGAWPASPHRRMDAGAIGVLVADYPLQLYPAGHPPLAATARYFVENSLVHGGFFQDMTHSGMNIYLTLMLAQSLLRDNDPDWIPLFRSVCELASDTGMWPEAVHPLSKGGCIGDGQHGWAAAEFALWIRNAFIREDSDRLVLGSGLLPEWLQNGEELAYGPCPTRWGPTAVTFRRRANTWVAALRNDWHRRPTEIEVRFPSIESGTPSQEVTLEESLL